MQRGENDLPIGFQAHCRAASEGDAMSIELKQAAQVAIDAKREAVAKAKAAGLTDADLLALGLRA